MDYQVFDIITIIISIGLLLPNVKKVRASSIVIIYLFFFFIYVLPLILDYVVGFPEYFFHWDATYTTYDKYAGFIESYKDNETRILYDFFILLTQIILSVKIKGISNYNAIRFSKEVNAIINQDIQKVFFVVSFMPIIFSLLAGYYYIPFIYGWRENPLLSFVQLGNYYSTIERTTYIGVTTSMICMLSPSKKWTYRILMICVCYMNISIESKRSIVFYAMALFLLLKYKGFGTKINMKLLALIAIIFSSIIVFYSIYIKTTVRGYSDIDQVYTNVRIDMFRDDTARLVLYSFVSSMKNVVDWPFQSYLTEIAYLFPLDIINGIMQLHIPMIGFNGYLTSSLVGASLDEGQRWMTTSMVDEIIANFYLISYIIVPLVFIKFSKYIDKKSGAIQVLILCGMLLGFMYTFNYIAYYIQFVIIMVYLENKKRKYE